MPEDDKIDDLSRRLQAAERDRAALEARLRALEQQRTSTKAQTQKLYPLDIDRRLPHFWLRDLLIALVVGLLILGGVDYLLTGDGIPLLAESRTARSTSTTASIPTDARAQGNEPQTSDPRATVTPAALLAPTALPRTAAAQAPTNGASAAAAGNPTMVGSPVPTTQPAPTMTVVPTVTPTAVPTATPITQPAATPTIADDPPTTLVGTPDPFIEDAFSSTSSGWPIRETSTASAAYVDGRYQLVLDGQERVSLSTAFSVPDYQLSVDVAVKEGSAGIVFLSAEPATFYHLVVRPNGTYAIQVLDQAANMLNNVVDWTESSALQRGVDVTNHLRIERQSARVTFFANDQQLTEFTIPSGAFVNQYGFVLIAPTGQGQATFDNLVGERLPNS